MLIRTVLRQTELLFFAVFVSLSSVGCVSTVQKLPVELVTPSQTSEMQAHRAVYEIMLDHRDPRADIVTVAGALAYELREACDSWQTEVQFEASFGLITKSIQQLQWIYTTQEAKNNQQFGFGLRKWVNGKLDEEISGKASLTEVDGPGVANFIKPNRVEIPLEAGTIFPTEHTIQVIAAAERGELLFMRTVFDGTKSEPGSEINAVIAKSTIPDTSIPTKPDFSSSLLQEISWPVRLAYFPHDFMKATPEYEESIRLQKNGVARSLLLEYEGFTLRGTLQSLKALPDPQGCS